MVSSVVELMDVSGTDLTVVNAARVSFAKHKDAFDESDEKLIKYLAKHNHWSPFAHTFIQFKISAPIFVARQLVKHQVGLVWNEVSRRYVNDEPEFYIPKQWRKKPEGSIKQGSSKETIEYDIAGTMKYVKETYNNLLKEGIAPEMARMVLPQNTMTQWYWSGNLFAFSRVCELRLKADAQEETRDVVNEINRLCSYKFPVSWKHLRPVPY